MDYTSLMFVLGVQLLVAGCLACWWGGWHLVRDEYDLGGWILLAFGTLGVSLFGYLTFRAHGWVDLGLVVGVPALLSIPAYWIYRSKEQFRVFIWIAIVLAAALFGLGLSVDTVASSGSTGYWSLGASVLTSLPVVYLYRNYTLRPGLDDRQRSRTERWAIIGTLLGLTVGRAIMDQVLEDLAPESRAAVVTFAISSLTFSSLGCAIWRFVWELRKRRR